jgi:hypothetical protein
MMIMMISVPLATMSPSDQTLVIENASATFSLVASSEAAAGSAAAG